MLDTYTQRRADFQTQIDALESRSSKASNLRTLAFFGSIGCLLVAHNAPLPQPLTYILYALGILLIPVFVTIVLKHRKIVEAIDRASYLKQQNADAAARIDRDWENFPVPLTPAEFRDHATARDLDIFGKASLFHFLNTAITPGGRERLADWLSNPAPPETAAARQPAVRELAPQLDWRQQLHFAGRDLHDRDESKNTTPTRADDKQWITNNSALQLASKALPSLAILLVLCHASGLLSKAWWILPIVVMAILSKLFAKKIHHTLADIRREESALQAYTAVFEKLGELEPTSDWLKKHHQAIDGAHTAVEELCNYATSNAARGSIVYPLLQYGLMWDFHTARGVEKWHTTHSTKVTAWFEALAQIEAAASLANLHHDEPDWVFPEFTTDKKIVSKDLGHPLIDTDTRVSNHLTIDPPGHFLLVTGSNMSGKSTLLRSLGLNVTLAQAGAPTCTSALSLSPVQLVTSLRVEDSLTEGVSFFMAELNRIKSAVQLADSPPENRTILYLFDEILRGTNSVERQAIVQRLIGHLLKKDAIGAITTHDLALAEIEDLKPAAKAIHFREGFKDTPKGPKMTFDYQLREGLATTTNAIKLLEMIDLHL